MIKIKKGESKKFEDRTNAPVNEKNGLHDTMGREILKGPFGKFCNLEFPEPHPLLPSMFKKPKA